jgi:hypothetical protein
MSSFGSALRLAEVGGSMSYSVLCPCGIAIKVTATQAGAEISCVCGQSTTVPLLSQLRQTTGHEAYETGTIDTINRMIRDDQLPSGDTCAICCAPTRDFYDLYVQCESKWIRGPGIGRYLFAAFSILVLPFWILWYLLAHALLDEERVESGRERGVSVPLRVCNSHHSQLRRTRSQRRLRKLLRPVPIYMQLLEEFPCAKITPEPPVPSSAMMVE